MSREAPPTHRTWAADWARWLWSATPLYWVIQASVWLAIVMAGTLALPAGEVSLMGRALLPIVDASVLALATHVGVRPLLRMKFSERNPGVSAWLGLLGWLALLALLGQAARMGAAGHLQEVDLELGAEKLAQLGITLSPMVLQLISATNLFATLLLWSGLYLGLRALMIQRQVQKQTEAARLHLLAAQLSPHFLFNALNSIRAMVFENQSKAASLITQLSALLRVHLHPGLPAVIPLEQDWDIARRYLEIEAVRLESRLQLDVHIAPECLARPVPALTLLCLVENAVKHGIGPLAGGGRIRIAASESPQGWMLQVENACQTTARQPGARSGLNNLIERVRILSRGLAKVSVESGQTRFSVTLELPEAYALG